MSYSSVIIERAREYRRSGLSVGQIATKFGVSKSTASIWTSKEIVTVIGQKRIINRQNKARKKAFATMEKRRALIRKIIAKNAKSTLNKIKLDKNLSKLLCSIFIWTEGAKGKFTYVGFANSDPSMVESFLRLLRMAFVLNETKFRVLVHIHEYHDEEKTLNFWSKITKIPRSQFHKSYLKPHTGKRKREGYMGSIHIGYFDYRVARELASVYNMFADKLRGVG